MGTITVNIDNDTEKTFREVVKEEYGVGKGKLGGAIQEALGLWIKEKNEEDIAKRQMDLMKKGFNMGKYKFDRDELHDRSF
jgi:hypothetical protein